MQFRYVGRESYIGEQKLDKLGQAITLDAETAQVAKEGNALLLTEEQFESVGFTADELRTYADPGSWPDATPEFREKLKLARALAREEV
jgi:hypothetical protein